MNLLPFKMKRIGAFLSPTGLLFWILMQFDIFYDLLESSIQGNALYILNVSIAILGFFSFLIGIYFLIFSKQKIEDELARDTRLTSFQFASLFQLLYIMAGFIVMATINVPEDDGLLMFFVSAVILFYITFIVRFNYLLHSKYNNEG